MEKQWEWTPSGPRRLPPLWPLPAPSRCENCGAPGDSVDGEWYCEEVGEGAERRVVEICPNCRKRPA